MGGKSSWDGNDAGFAGRNQLHADLSPDHVSSSDPESHPKVGFESASGFGFRVSSIETNFRCRFRVSGFGFRRLKPTFTVGFGFWVSSIETHLRCRFRVSGFGFRSSKPTSTLHCRGKNGRSKKIGQTNQEMIHFVPNMYVSGKISALRPGTQTLMIFGTTKKIRKLPKTTRFQDLRVFACFCVFLRAFCRFFAGFCGFYPQSFDALQTFFGLCLTKPKNMQSKS